VFAIVGSAAFARAPGRIAIAATFDLTVTATLIVWRFGVRRRALPGWIAVATFSGGGRDGPCLGPHAPLSALAALGGVLEVVTMGWLLVRIRRARTLPAHETNGVEPSTSSTCPIWPVNPPRSARRSTAGCSREADSTPRGS